MLSHTEFRRARYFPEIDGIRAISVLMVLAFHSTDPLWRHLNGHLGVPIFFVISGFLITTLLLREEARKGRIDIGAFYLRRTFRIFPMYYLALAIYLVLALVLHMGSGSATFLERLPWLLTYNGEFAGPGTFSHSWSLGIEEKFYLLWPALAFLIPAFARRRGAVAAALLSICAVTATFPAVDYFAIYVPILAGCTLAVAMHHERSFRVVARMASWPAAIPLAALTLLLLIVNEKDQLQNAPFSLALALLFPTFLIGSPKIRRMLSGRAIRHIGVLAYGIYLFHPIVISGIDLMTPAGGSALHQVVRFAVIVVTSIAVAALARVFVEQPMINLGHRVIGRRAQKAQRREAARHSGRSAGSAGVEVLPQRAVADDRAHTDTEPGVDVVRDVADRLGQLRHVHPPARRLGADRAAGSDVQAGPAAGRADRQVVALAPDDQSSGGTDVEHPLDRVRGPDVGQGEVRRGVDVRDPRHPIQHHI